MVENVVHDEFQKLLYMERVREIGLMNLSILEIIVFRYFKMLSISVTFALQ